MIKYQQEKKKGEVKPAIFAVTDISDLFEQLNAPVISHKIPKWDPPFVGVTCEVFFVNENSSEKKGAETSLEQDGTCPRKQENVMGENGKPWGEKVRE